MKILLSLLVISLISVSAYSVEFDKSVPKKIQDQINKDLDFLYGVKLTKQSKLHTKIFGKFDKDNYKKYFEKRIFNVKYDNDPNSTAMAYVSLFIPNTMFLANNYLKYQQPQIARAMIVYHEARHTEYLKGNWRHANCPTPFIGEDGKEIVGIVTGMKLEGLAACDTTALGAYATGSILGKNIAKYCANCSEKVKMDGDLFAMDALKRIIDVKARNEMKKDFLE